MMYILDCLSVNVGNHGTRYPVSGGARPREIVIGVRGVFFCVFIACAGTGRHVGIVAARLRRDLPRALRQRTTTAVGLSRSAPSRFTDGKASGDAPSANRLVEKLASTDVEEQHLVNDRATNVAGGTFSFSLSRRCYRRGDGTDVASRSPSTTRQSARKESSLIYLVHLVSSSFSSSSPSSPSSTKPRTRLSRDLAMSSSFPSP